ncbi:DUF2332 domain-containing protein [Micromonospora sp. WMMA1363]|uniref:DUF2332 domain-containing protein n=1 Tax=Micromonospora sp. WMMA1363 TaxID=3053985 RepID=UPI00259CC000|nr:DUF2332 domain-containing protein [Micromonospora sp. WMMA1363]MDM4721420.1 DUF2332 domain-containing protein [Micromonospora sp. WMMA1363]
MPYDQAAAAMEKQAQACRNMDAGLYADLLVRAADDVRAAGPCADVVEGYADAPVSAVVPLRVLGGVHALVLTGRAPELARFYPSAGGAYRAGDANAAWTAFRAVVATERDAVRAWLPRPPQTNEVGRANLLLAGLLHAVAETGQRPVRLIELGASAGLNLRADRFRIVSGDFAWGPVDSPVVLPDAWRGGVPGWLRDTTHTVPELTVVERLGCDTTPLDPESAAGALALHAYVWPEHTARAARLAGALDLAARMPVEVVPAGAADFLAGIRPEAGTLTVVWHSVMRQYVPAQEWARVIDELARLGAAATPDAPVAHLLFEPYPRAGRYRFQLRARLNTRPERLLAEAHPHGLPARAI